MSSYGHCIRTKINHKTTENESHSTKNEEFKTHLRLFRFHLIDVIFVIFIWFVWNTQVSFFPNGHFNPTPLPNLSNALPLTLNWADLNKHDYLSYNNLNNRENEEGVYLKQNCINVLKMLQFYFFAIIKFSYFKLINVFMYFIIS